MKQAMDLAIDLIVQLRRRLERMRSRDRSEVLVPQLQLQSSRPKVLFPQSATHHGGEAHQCRFELRHVRRVLIVGVLVAYGFRPFVSANLAFEPGPCIFAAGLAGERESPLAELTFEVCVIEPRKITNLANANRVQLLFCYFADAWNFPNIERSQKFRLTACQNVSTPFGLALPEHTLAIRRDAPI